MAIFEFNQATEDKTDLIPLMVVEGISQYARNIIRPPPNCLLDGNLDSLKPYRFCLPDLRIWFLCHKAWPKAIFFLLNFLCRWINWPCQQRTKVGGVKAACHLWWIYENSKQYQLQGCRYKVRWHHKGSGIRFKEIARYSRKRSNCRNFSHFWSSWNRCRWCHIHSNQVHRNCIALFGMSL